MIDADKVSSQSLTNVFLVLNSSPTASDVWVQPNVMNASQATFLRTRSVSFVTRNSHTVNNAVMKPIVVFAKKAPILTSNLLCVIFAWSTVRLAHLVKIVSNVFKDTFSTTVNVINVRSIFNIVLLAAIQLLAKSVQLLPFWIQNLLLASYAVFWYLTAEIVTITKPVASVKAVMICQVENAWRVVQTWLSS